VLDSRKNIELITSKDGSHTLYVPELDETYHSTHGAIQEAEHVFIKHGLVDFIAEDKRVVRVLEVGFGTGLNALLTAQYAEMNPETTINYHTIEAYPLSWDLLKQLNYTSLIKDSQDVFEILHQSQWGEKKSILANFNFLKEEVFLEQFTSDNKYDIVFFDAFAPNHQEEMWEISQLKIVIDLIVEGGFFITYCAKGQLKRDLKSLGLSVESLLGPPGKREMVRARK